MNVDKSAMLLYVVTDRTWLGGRELAGQVEDTLRAGATFVQLREKELDDRAFLEQAHRIQQVTRRYHVPFVVNDNVAVARTSGADGVHIGQSDAALRDARAALGPDKIIGVSVSTVEQAERAQQGGADYLGVGAVFATATKQDADSVSHETLRAICSAARIPVVAIGGISADNVLELSGTGVDGIAVISAIFAQPDIYAASKRLHELAKEMVKR